MKYYQTLKITLLPATNNKGTRVKITSLNNKRCIILPYNYNFVTSKDMIINHLNELNIEIYGVSELYKETLLLIDNNIEI